MTAFQGLDFYDADSLLAEEERQVRDMVRDWVTEKILPIIETHARQDSFPMELIPEMGELGLFGASFANPFGAAQIAHILVVLLVISFPIATRFVLPRAIFADVVDEDEKLTGYRREAMYNGMEGIVSKTAAALVPLITTQLFRAFGAEPGHNLGVLLVGPVAGVFVFLGLIAFLRYPLRD